VSIFLELRDLHHAVDAARLPDANLSGADAHGIKWLPIYWLKPCLDLPQLETRFLPGMSWEGRQIAVGLPNGPVFRRPCSRHVEGLYALFDARQGDAVSRRPLAPNQAVGAGFVDKRGARSPIAADTRRGEPVSTPQVPSAADDSDESASLKLNAVAEHPLQIGPRYEDVAEAYRAWFRDRTAFS